MPGVDVFCERCGARQPTERRDGAAAGATFARRLRSAVTGTTADGVHAPDNSMFLRLCLECREYACPACWNDEVGLCQTCEPLPEPEFVLPIFPPLVEAPSAQPVAWPQPEHLPVFEPTYFVADEPVVVAEAQPEPVVVAEAQPEPVVMAEAQPEPEPEPVTTPPPLPITRVPRPRYEPTPLPLAAAMPAPVVLPSPRPQISFDESGAAAASLVPLAPPPMAMPVPVQFLAQAYHLPVPQRPTVAGPVGVRPCRNCQLAVSAKAHFCRRCGTAQLAS